MTAPYGPGDELEAPLPPGTVVDEYVVEELFTRGPSSAIYRSRQPSLDRTVALKLLPRARSADSRWVERFRRGARVLARISHPNIVPVFGVGTYGGREFLAMHFVDGGKALDVAYPAPKSEADLAGLLKAAAEAAQALSFVHEQGVVHGDLRPSNILVAPNGRAYLIDFDFASRRGERAQAEFEDDRSSGFVPPEFSLQGDRDADPSGDVYGLGAALFATLAGGPPRRGGTPPLNDVRPDLPKTLCAIVDRCLRPDPKARFESAKEVAEALVDVVDALAEPGPGRSLGPYEIVSEAGRGGMGVVYRAIERPLGREVALKVLPPEFSAFPTRVKRFQREAEAVSKLEHPNIVPIHAFGRAGGYHYFAMKFIRGSTVAAIIERMRGRRKDGLDDDEAFAFEFRSSSGSRGDDTVPTRAAEAPPAPVDDDAPSPQADTESNATSSDPEYVAEMTRVFIAAARALAFAHDHGILHRDVKPANVMIEDGGRPYVLDFGLAREEKDLELTESAGAVGTPYYMAPEQIKRDPERPVDRRTDVWGLGVALYETLALRRPFAASGADELFAEIRRADPQPLRRFNVEASRELEAVVMKTLRGDPAERYQDMHALADDLEAALDGRDVTARPVSALSAALSRARRHRVPTGAAVLAAFVFAIGALIAAPFAAPFLFDDGGPGPETSRDKSGTPPGPTRVTTPPGVGAVVRVFEDPARPDRPAVYAVPAVWFGDEKTAVFPAEAAPAVPDGFNERKHGQLIWVLPRAPIPFSLTDPGMFATGGGIARNLDRLKGALGAATDAAHAAPGLGMCELLPVRAGRWIAYKLHSEASAEGAALDALAAFLPGAFLPARFLEYLVEETRVDRLDEQRGSLQIGPNGVVRAITPASTQGLGWLVTGVDDRVYGYLRKGGFFASIAEMRGDR